ncbi:MAG: hypothetical protein VW867_10725, partial [Gammaproteobacteria bacterium]
KLSKTALDLFFPLKHLTRQACGSPTSAKSRLTRKNNVRCGEIANEKWTLSVFKRNHVDIFTLLLTVEKRIPSRLRSKHAQPTVGRSTFMG